MLDDYRTAPISDKLKVMLGFLEKLTLSPDEVQPADSTALCEAGISDEAIVQAVYVCTVLNIIDRVADAFGFDVPPLESFTGSANTLLKRGYKM